MASSHLSSWSLSMDLVRRQPHINPQEAALFPLSHTLVNSFNSKEHALEVDTVSERGTMSPFGEGDTRLSLDYLELDE